MLAVCPMKHVDTVGLLRSIPLSLNTEGKYNLKQRSLLIVTVQLSQTYQFKQTIFIYGRGYGDETMNTK